MKGPRVFTLDQANELIPKFEKVFKAIDAIRHKMQTSKLRLNALEMIWGEGLQKADCPDHAEFQHYLEEMKSLQESFHAEAAKIPEMGAMLKGMEPELVDFYGVRDGYLVYLCWRRGEPRVTHWHDLESGFAGRQPW